MTGLIIPTSELLEHISDTHLFNFQAKPIALELISDMGGVVLEETTPIRMEKLQLKDKGPKQTMRANLCHQLCI